MRLVSIAIHQKAVVRNQVWSAEVVAPEFKMAIDTIDETMLVVIWKKWFERMAKCVAAYGVCV